MAEYRLTTAAVRDLENIWRYTCSEWSADQADRYTDVLTDIFELLADAPDQSHACDDIRAGYRRRKVERHVIYFRKTSYGIAVVRILHGRMDAARHL